MKKRTAEPDFTMTEAQLQALAASARSRKTGRTWAGLGQRGALRLDGNVWRLTYRLPQNADGRRSRKSIALGTRAELRDRNAARAAADRAMEHLVPPTLPPGASPAWSDWCARYVNVYLPRLRASTRAGQTSVVCVHLQPAFEKLHLHEIDARRIQTFLDAQNRAGASPSTTRARFNVLRRMLRCAAGEGLAAAVISAAAFEFARDGRVQRTVADLAFTEDELAQILPAAPEPIATLARLGLFAGLRPAESLALEWRDIDWDAARLAVRQQAPRKHVTRPKTKASASAVPMPEDLIEHLRAYRARWPENPGGYLFAGPDGTPLCSSGVRKRLAPLLKELGVRRLSLQGLRHSYGMRLGRTGASLATLKRAMRQSSLAAVECYVAAASVDVEQAVTRASLVSSVCHFGLPDGR